MEYDGMIMNNDNDPHNLALLEELTNKACVAAYRLRNRQLKDIGRIADDAINWADLGCVEACYVISLRDENRCRVVIEEANPSSWRLCAYIRRYLRNRGFDDVEVNTEW